MKYVYASKTGHVEKIIGKLGLEAMKITDGSEKTDGDFIIFTYTIGLGKTPKAVELFLENNKGVKAVVGSGSNSFLHKNTFNFAAENISKRYNVPILAKLNGVGTDEEIAALKAEIEKMQ